MTNREIAIMNEAFMVGRIYTKMGEKEKPVEIQKKLEEKCKMKADAEQSPETGQVDAIVNALTSRKQHWMSESRRLVIEKPDSEEAEDATHMYGVYIDAVDDMKTFLKEGH